MDPTLTDAELESRLPESSDVASPGDRAWSPLSTRGARISWLLLVVFALIYFVVAILTSAEFADLAAIMIVGLPLGFILGIGLIVAGLVITRAYLAWIEG